MDLNGDCNSAFKSVRSSILTFSLGVVLHTTAFFSPYWLQSFPDEKVPESKFTNLGLWEVCLNGFHDMRHQYEVRFHGCKHILLEEYDIIRKEIQPPFFVATQFFYTLSFTAILVAVVFVLMYLLCVEEYYRVSILRWTGIDLIVAGIFGTIALIIFGALGDSRHFMPDWENNYLSWSFGLAFVGTFLEYLSGALFIIEARIMNRKDIAREQQYPMERAV